MTSSLVHHRYDDGKTFVVKDTEKFATDVIPAYFKHNNFSSFVRQLNFYGFRKIKSGSLRIAEAASSEESKYWKFRHEKFQRGRPDLLTQIRKNTTETADKQEVDQLRSEVRDLRASLARVNDDVAKLKAVVELLVKSQDVSGITYPEFSSSKKRKIADFPVSAPTSTPFSSVVPLPETVGLTSDVMSDIREDSVPLPVTSEASLIPIPVPSSDDAIKSSSLTLMPSVDESWPEISSIKPSSAYTHRNDSVGTTLSSTLDDDMLISSLLGINDDDDDDAFFEGFDSVGVTSESL
jgi:HSF-type DNA-binding